MLLFYIPGVYLEWPADPWEHLRRINEWRVLDTVTAHSTWLKSSYFIPYSLLCWCTGLRQIFWLDFYYTDICLLLCWQYYRLARACDLGDRASMMFVLLQALLFGNNIFSFYRYYGISSSIYAQLGAIALTRLALEAAKSPEVSLRSFFSLPPFISRLTGLRQQYTDLPSSAPPSTVHCPPSSYSPPTVYRLLLSCSLLLALTAFNHVQGLGIAGLGIAAVVVWRLIEWRRSMIGWLALIAIILSAATIWWYPRQPALDAIYRPQGWLTLWYGFNLHAADSAAFDRMAAIVGLSGLFNFIACIFLFRRNHIVAWLTLMPVIALCLPFIAIPLSSFLSSRGAGEIVTYHRILFAIPAGLALLALGVSLLDLGMKTGAGEKENGKQPWVPALRSSYTLFLAPCSLLIFSLTALTQVPASSPSFSRCYNTLMRPSADLSMGHVLEAIEKLDLREAGEESHTPIIASAGPAFVFSTTGLRQVSNKNRLIKYSSAFRISAAQYSIDTVVQDRRQIAVLTIFFGHDLYTPISFTGYLSKHWLSQEVAVTHIGGPELERSAHELGYRKVEKGGFEYYLYRPK